MLGNFYFSNLFTALLQPHPRHEENLKHSYKFYYTVLEDSGNRSLLPAAIGLGAVCAEREEFDAARDIFTKVGGTVDCAVGCGL